MLPVAQIATLTGPGEDSLNPTAEEYDDFGTPGLYFTMSLFGPYQVYLMKTSLAAS